MSTKHAVGRSKATIAPRVKPPQQHASTSGRLLWSVVVVAVTVVVYWPVIGHEFLEWDDNLNITENRYLNPVSWSNVAHFWREPFAGMYVPVTYSWFAAEAVLAERTAAGAQGAARLDARVFHLGNLLLHSACVVLVFVLLARLLDHAPAACLGALFFSLHPLHVESVAWVTESKGLLSSVFSLLAILGYLRYAEGASSAPGRWMYLTLASVAYGLALLAKPSAVAVPLVAWVLDFGWLGRRLRDTLPVVVAWGLIAGVVVWITKGQQQIGTFYHEPEVWQRPLVAADALAFYLYKLVVPWPLAPEYGRSANVVLNEWWGYATWLAPVILASVLAVLPRRRVWLVSYGIFVAALLPVLGFVPFYFQRYSTVADRYAYLAILGPSLVVAWWRANTPSKKRFAIAAAAICVLGALSLKQSFVWRDNATLFLHGVRVAPRSFLAHNHVAHHYVDKGDPAAAERYFRQSLVINPDYYEGHNDLGIVLFRQGRLDEAEQAYRRSLAINDQVAPAHLNLAGLLVARHRPEEAETHFREAIRIRRDNADAYFGLASLLAQGGQSDEAIAFFRQGLELNWNEATAHKNLAVVLESQGRAAEAVPHYRAALDLKIPDWTEVANNLAWILATHAGQNVRNGRDAVELAQSACSATALPPPEYLDTLAAALAEQGRFEEAVQAAERALRLVEERIQDKPAREIRERIALYRSRKPYRSP